MIQTIALTKNLDLLENVDLKTLNMDDILWYWVNFEAPTIEESDLLSNYFKFHDLSIEDCLDVLLERPKIDYYGSYKFFVLYALNQKTLEPIELAMFVGDNYVVTFCKQKLPEIDAVHTTILDSLKTKDIGHLFIVYKILDNVVDYYYPAIYRIEDYLENIELKEKPTKINNLIDEVFNLRSDLMKLRRVINPMKELLFTIINSDNLEDIRGSKLHFSDIYDHLVRLFDTIESNRDITADIRDNYLSINSHRMNKIITILTIITSIFIPLTFIVGVYGMNFDYMPELRWKYGYFLVLAVMGIIVVSMTLLFKRRGWFDIKK